jgi:hypothetical protein
MPSFKAKKKSFLKGTTAPLPFALEGEAQPRAGRVRKRLTTTEAEYFELCARNDRGEIWIFSLEACAEGRNSWWRFHYVDYGNQKDEPEEDGAGRGAP